MSKRPGKSYNTKPLRLTTRAKQSWTFNALMDLYIDEMCRCSESDAALIWTWHSRHLTRSSLHEQFITLYHTNKRIGTGCISRMYGAGRNTVDSVVSNERWSSKTSIPCESKYEHRDRLKRCSRESQAASLSAAWNQNKMNLVQMYICPGIMQSSL